MYPKLLHAHKLVVRKLKKFLGNEEKLRRRIWTIFVRNKDGDWVFDYPSLGIIDEPFVEGIPQIIEHHLKKMNLLATARQEGFVVQFTVDGKLSHTDLKLELEEEDAEGGHFIDNSSGLRGWLCPDLRTFLGRVPEKLSVKIG